MKKQRKKSVKARDLKPLKNVTGGRHRGHAHGSHAAAFAERGEGGAGLGPFGLRSVQ